MNSPRYKHECERCVYLGDHVVTPRDRPDKRYDLYYCTQHGSLPTVIARFGNEGQNYISGLFEGQCNPVLVVAMVRALKAFSAGTIRKRRQVVLFASPHGDDHTAKFADEKGKWEFSKRSATHALGELVRSHPDDFGVEIEWTSDWSKR